jgi:hypothetical protein
MSDSEPKVIGAHMRRTDLITELRLDELEKRLEQRFHYNDETRLKSENELERRLDRMNEFRAMIERREATFINREFFDERTGAHAREDEKFHAEAGARLGVLEQWKSNINGRIWGVAIGLGSLFTIIQIGIALLRPK